MINASRSKRLLSSLAFAGAVLTGCLSASDVTNADAPSYGVANLFETGVPVVVAHRGCWRNAPENSIAAIDACAQLGIDMVEIDIRQTADGVLVLMHDDTLDRTTTLSGSVSTYTLADLRAAFLKEGSGGREAAVTTERIPTLDEALQAGDGLMLINLDIKDTLYDQALKIIESAGAEDRILFKMRAAPKDPALTDALFRGRAPFMPILVQCSDQSRDRYCVDDLGEAALLYKDFDPVAFEVVFTNDAFLFEDVEMLIDAGHPIWVNTLYPSISGGRRDDDALKEPDKIWGSLLDMGVTIFQTDHPAALMRYLKERGER